VRTAAQAVSVTLTLVQHTLGQYVDAFALMRRTQIQALSYNQIWCTTMS
jgi:hypothetical protein